MPDEGSSGRGQRRERHHDWRGDDAAPQSGRNRAIRWFPMPPGQVCAECEHAPATVRHHWDGNPLNNDRNVVWLCRRCHQRIHIGKPPRPCAECGRLRKVLKRGFCEACYRRRWKRGDFS